MSHLYIEVNESSKYHERMNGWMMYVLPARYPTWGRSLIKNFGHVRDMVDF